MIGKMILPWFGGSAAHWKPLHPGDPSARILLLLAATIGLPYMLLAATSPLLQAWYVSLKPGTVPYRLFALSNVGSFLALFSFPALAEPLLTTHAQAYSWSAFYVIFVALCSFAAFIAMRAGKDPLGSLAAGIQSDEAPPPWTSRLLWIALPGCASGLLLAFTTHVSQNVAPIPLLWVAPLGIYLL